MKTIGSRYRWNYDYSVDGEEPRWQYYIVIDYNPRRKFYTLLFDDGETDDYKYTELIKDKRYRCGNR